MTLNIAAAFAAKTCAILARSCPGRAFPPPLGEPAGAAGVFGAVGADGGGMELEGLDVGGVAVPVITQALSLLNCSGRIVNLEAAAFWAHLTHHPFSGGPIGRFSIPDSFWEQFKYSSIRAPAEVAARLDDAGILGNSRPEFRGICGGATQGVVGGGLHDQFPGDPHTSAAR
ncbi:hypothetical protein [Streptomyces sp. 7N604]|uniref:hypothetical protein n=1 Tax=Streptomyces sp. 7N604 TaxID=3457415 RepID=UPI003FD24491